MDFDFNNNEMNIKNIYDIINKYFIQDVSRLILQYYTKKFEIRRYNSRQYYKSLEFGERNCYYYFSKDQNPLTWLNGEDLYFEINKKIFLRVTL